MNDFRTGLLLELKLDGPVAVVGDIHGCADALDALLDKLGEMPVIVLGDLGDRGPGTRAVIDLLARRGAAGVRGNHDDWLIAWARGEGFDSFALHPVMGGRATLDSYGIKGASAGSIEAERAPRLARWPGRRHRPRGRRREVLARPRRRARRSARCRALGASAVVRPECSREAARLPPASRPQPQSRPSPHRRAPAGRGACRLGRDHRPRYRRG